MKNVIKLLIFAGVCIVSYRWDSIIDSLGRAVPGAITEKRESIRTNYADWFRRFQIVAAFKTPGYPLERHTICDVDQEIFDGLHAGSTVTVHYLPALVNLPILPGTHISSCPPWGIFGSNPELYRRSLYLYGSLAILLGMVFLLRIYHAAWLLPWFAVFVVYGLSPHIEPVPLEPRSVQAVVKQITLVRTILGGNADSESQPINLDYPYQLVALQYVPQGRNEPVVAVDGIDANSIPALTVGQVLNIDYDARNPRVARIPGATRMFREQAIWQLGLTYGSIAAVVLVALLFASRTRRTRKRRVV